MTKRRKRFPEGSVSGKIDPLSAAAMRAVDAHIALGRKAEALVEELDQITSPGVPRQKLSEEDSLVIAISAITDRDA